MKLLLTVLSVSCLIAGVAITAQAAPTNVWVESLSDGECEVAGLEYDWSMTYVGVEHYFKNKVKLGLELGTGKIIDDLDLWEFKVGYRLIDRKNFGLDLYASRLEVDGDWIDINGTFVGADFDWKLTNKLLLTGSVGYTVDADFRGYDDFDILAYKLKLGYQITKALTFNVGYRGYDTSMKHAPDYRLGGYTLGLTYKF